jgi:hypothetical protein
LQSRLLRELTLQGRFPDMDALIPGILREYRSCGLDLDDPESLTPSPAAPFNVAGLLYCLGMREVIGHKDHRRGIAYLDACVAWQSRATALLSIAGVEDASAATTARVAGWQAATARIALDAADEHDRRIGQGNLDELSPFHRRLLFAELVNRGDHRRAARHYDYVTTTVETLGGGADEFKDGSIGHHAMTLFTLGIFALNHRSDRSAARLWFGRAIDVAGRDPACASIRDAAVIALRRASDIAPSAPATAGLPVRGPAGTWSFGAGSGPGASFGRLLSRLMKRSPSPKSPAKDL